MLGAGGADRREPDLARVPGDRPGRRARRPSPRASWSTRRRARPAGRSPPSRGHSRKIATRLSDERLRRRPAVRAPARRLRGLTPTAQSRPAPAAISSTITCACGAAHDRWVPPRRPSQPLPRPSRRRSPPAPAVARPGRRGPDRMAGATGGAAAAAGRDRQPPRRARAAVPSGWCGSSSRRGHWRGRLRRRVSRAGRAAREPPSRPSLSRGAPRHHVAPGDHRTPAGHPPRPALALTTSSLHCASCRADTTPSISLNDYASPRGRDAQPPSRSSRRGRRNRCGLGRARCWTARAGRRRLARAHAGRPGRMGAAGTGPGDRPLPGGQARRRAAASPASAAARARARGVAVAAALLPLWECAAEKVAALEQTPAGG